MSVNKNLLAPCGLYCGVCSIYIAHRDNNQKFKEILTGVYGVPLEEIQCEGCLSPEPFVYCRSCPIKDCTREREYEGCHQCDDFPCEHIDNFPIPVGKKVILRAIPQWREMGTEAWVKAEEERYNCPECGYALFRGAKKCRECKTEVNLD